MLFTSKMAEIFCHNDDFCMVILPTKKRSWPSKLHLSETMMIQVFAAFALIIGALGLYGLIDFMAIRKTKEIGIRKVLGVSRAGILILYSREVIVLLLVSFLLAAPVPNIYLDNWLSHYSYKISVDLTVYISAFFTTLLIALITISYRTIKSASLNPVSVLKDE